MKTQITTILTLLFVAACGGGGGGGGDGANNAPEIAGRPATVARAGDAFSFTPQATDADGDRLSFSAENLPDWAFFDAGSGTVSGFPDKTHYGAYDDIIIWASDGTSRASLRFSLDVLPPLLGRENIMTPLVEIPGSDAMQATGTLTFNVDGEEKNFEESDLQLRFDEEGNLIEMVGETVIPPRVSEHLSLDAGIKTTIGYFSGKELNADPDIDILLKDEQYYFVYFFSTDLDITLKDRDGSNGTSQLTIGTPFGSTILFITDPSDVMVYYFGNLGPLGEAGVGASDNGFIPFEPSLDYEELASFDGHTVFKGSVGLGVKVFDFFSIDGFSVTHQPDFLEIDLGDPLSSPIEYRLGINGQADFAFAIVGFELFRFNLTEASTTLEVSQERQQMAMRSRTAPEVDWIPAILPFDPQSETLGDWFVNGDGSYEVSLSSTYRSTVPAADVAGKMLFKDGIVTLSGTIEHDERPLGIQATFFPDGVNAEIDLRFDLDPGSKEQVLSAMDDKIDEWHQAFDDLQQATADYEFELSLRGARESLPHIVDSAISILDGIPGEVRNAVDTAIVNYVNNYRSCVNVPVPYPPWSERVCTNPLDPLIDENKVGDDKGAEARTIAINAIAPYKSRLTALKTAAQLADDDQFRAAIKDALQAVYDNRNFKKTITINYNFPLVGNRTVYSRTFDEPILTGSNLTLVKTALDNVDQIPATSSIMISAQQIYDQLPVEDAINTAKAEVENGLAQVPTSLDGVGYTVDNGVYSAYAILDGKQYDVDFNVLSPEELVAGIGRLVADGLVSP